MFLQLYHNSHKRAWELSKHLRSLLDKCGLSYTLSVSDSPKTDGDFNKGGTISINNVSYNGSSFEGVKRLKLILNQLIRRPIGKNGPRLFKHQSGKARIKCMKKLHEVSITSNDKVLCEEHKHTASNDVLYTSLGGVNSPKCLQIRTYLKTGKFEDRSIPPLFSKIKSLADVKRTLRLEKNKNGDPLRSSIRDRHSHSVIGACNNLSVNINQNIGSHNVRYLLAKAEPELNAKSGFLGKTGFAARIAEGISQFVEPAVNVNVTLCLGFSPFHTSSAGATGVKAIANGSVYRSVSGYGSPTRDSVLYLNFNLALELSLSDYFRWWYTIYKNNLSEGFTHKDMCILCATDLIERNKDGKPSWIEIAELEYKPDVIDPLRVNLRMAQLKYDDQNTVTYGFKTVKEPHSTSVFDLSSIRNETLSKFPKIKQLYW